MLVLLKKQFRYQRQNLYGEDVDMADGLNINRNDRFWMDAIDFLSSISRAGGYPDFLISWIKEVLNILKGERNRVYLVRPPDGCWGLYINNKDDYRFSNNEGENIYISYRLYKYLKEKNAYKLLAGLLLHETAEFIMRVRAEKKGYKIDINKNHGEAMRLEKALIGTLLSELFINLVDQELDRRRVSVDKKDIYVEGCAVSGEEIVAEVCSFNVPGESFILQLAPGQKKPLPYSGGYFTVQADDFTDPFKIGAIDFKTYCGLMKIIDDLFIEESIVNGEGPFLELLTYIRGLDFTKEEDSFLLKMLWLFIKPQEEGLLYNMYLIVDEYITYFIMRDIVKRHWREGRYIKDNVKEIVEEVNEKKETVFHSVLKDKIEEWLISWFSKMDAVPGFLHIDTLKWEEKIPHYITKYYKKKPRSRGLTDIELHEEVLKISQGLRALMSESRGYRGFERREDPRVCELKMVRVHFWKDKDIFTNGDIVEISSSGFAPLEARPASGGTAADFSGLLLMGFAEVIDVKEYSIVVFLQDEETKIPEIGYVKKLEEEDLSIKVSLEAISKLKRNRWVNELL